jgi:HD-GYP domain-containing protein (c-di-GMP phosphodiesterase class II)
VLKVDVNFEKSKLADADTETIKPTKNQSNSESTINNEQASEAKKHLAAIVNADELYNQAKSVQRKFVSQLRSGSTPNMNDLGNLSQDIIDSVFENADALSYLIMLKDPNEYLVEHAINCSILLTIFAQSKGMTQAEIEDLTMAGLLIDIGMASLPSDLLSNKASFNGSDWNMVKTHVDIGIELVERFGDVQPIILDVIANHHERINGSGYPKAKTASEISIYSQMAAIVDSYDAMTSDRNYKPPINATSALQLLEKDETLDRYLVIEFINAIGLHPVGSLVQLESKQLGIVSQRVLAQPLRPVVLVFYNLENQTNIDAQRADLSQTNDNIVSGVRPEEFSINLGSFFKKVLLPQSK